MKTGRLLTETPDGLRVCIYNDRVKKAAHFLASERHLSRQVDFIAEHHQPLVHAQGSHRLQDYAPRRTNVLAVLLESLVKQTWSISTWDMLRVCSLAPQRYVREGYRGLGWSSSLEARGMFQTEYFMGRFETIL